MSAAELGITEEQFRTFGIFNSYALRKTLEATRANQRFVYYTNADTAMRIIRNREIWMRKSHVMNDYREVEHGFECLNAAYQRHKQRLHDLLDAAFPGFCTRLEAHFNSWLPHFRTDTYITCLSEHDDSEDLYGRLSMWRAYGGNAGIAIVVNGGPFLRPTNALNAYSSPIAYYDDARVNADFVRLLDNIEREIDFVKSLGAEAVSGHVFHAFRHAVLCTKHPGFLEEREWRVIYQPSFQPSKRITSAIESINGTPQSVCKIPLADVPDEGLYGLSLPDFISRVIIGPSKFPVGVHDAFSALLREAGVKDVEHKLAFSNVPLRQ